MSNHPLILTKLNNHVYKLEWYFKSPLSLNYQSKPNNNPQIATHNIPINEGELLTIC